MRAQTLLAKAADQFRAYILTLPKLRRAIALLGSFPNM
ncbi:hypothetical protein PSP6_270189 [Paraburkholderia tropica]|nr:hypothetical protein PSP6_270189 [Paraburkholderia tropica]